MPPYDILDHLATAEAEICNLEHLSPDTHNAYETLFRRAHEEITALRSRAEEYHAVMTTLEQHGITIDQVGGDALGEHWRWILRDGGVTTTSIELWHTQRRP